MSKLKISIVIPSHNAARFIDETIQSILKQRYPNVECIVVDGGSNDGTLDILKRYEGRIRWISEKDEGQSDAINKGLRLASGDINAYICADDIYEAGCFQKVADFFGKNPHVMWAYGKCRVIDEDGSEIHRPIISYFDSWRRRYSYNRLLMIDFIPQPAVFWRKELVHKIGLFDINEHLAMDYEYWLRAGARYDPGFIPRAPSFKEFNESLKTSQAGIVHCHKVCQFPQAALSCRFAVHSPLLLYSYLKACFSAKN
jgi:glycosyltransferase involved in cell wall biosynthesis